MMKKASSLLYCYPGSKYRLARRFQRCFPPHRVYVDVFGGSGAMIARQEPRAVEVWNDLDFTVYNTLAAVKDARGCREILRLLTTTSNDREQYQNCKRILADENEPDTRRAWAFAVCGNIGFSAHPALASGWVCHERQRRDFLTLPARIKWWHGRLRNVQLENRPWQEIVDIYDGPDVLLFCDPPYLAEVLRNRGDQYYQCQMDVAAHVELIERLRRIKGFAFICGYNHPLYTRHLFHWRRVTFSARETMGGKAGRRKEIAWLNYHDDGSRLETNRLWIARRYVKIMGNEEEAIRYVERIKRLRRLLTNDHGEPKSQEH